MEADRAERERRVSLIVEALTAKLRAHAATLARSKSGRISYRVDPKTRKIDIDFEPRL